MSAPASTGTPASGIQPHRHFRRASLTDTPTVLIIGDSIATEDPQAADEADTMWGQIQARFIEQNPDIEFNFVNRAIGGATWTNLSTAVTLAASGLAYPQWGGIGAENWLFYAEYEQPDVVILALGMNDRQNFVTAQFRAAVNTILGWAKVPDIVFITNMVPNRNGVNTTISGVDAENGRSFVAGFVRSWAIYNGFAVIDLHRDQVRAVLGRDPRNSFFTKVANATVTSPWQATERCADFVVSLSGTATATLFNTPIRITTSEQGYPNSRTWCEIYKSGLKLAFRFMFVDDGGSGVISIVSDVDAPTSGSYVIRAAFKDVMASIKLGTQSIYEGRVIRAGGLFRPKVTWGANAFLRQFWFGTWAPVTTIMTDLEMWGGPGINPTLGGNGENHPSSYGSALVYGPLFDRQDFRLPVMIEGTTDFPSTTLRRAGIGTAKPQGLMHIVKTAVANFLAQSVSNNLIVEDESSAGVQLVSGDAGVTRLQMGTVAAPNMAGISALSATGKLTLRAGDTNVGELVVPVSDDTTTMTLLIRIGGVNILKQVKLGPASGGFRVLRVTE